MFDNATIIKLDGAIQIRPNDKTEELNLYIETLFNLVRRKKGSAQGPFLQNNLIKIFWHGNAIEAYVGETRIEVFKNLIKLYIDVESKDHRHIVNTFKSVFVFLKNALIN